MASKGFSAPEPGQVYDRARELCERLNRPAELAPVLHGQFVYRFVRAELDRAEHHAHEMLHLGDTLNDVRWRHAGLYLSGVLYSVMGKFTKACVYSEDALSLWNPDFRTFADLPEDPDVSVRLYYHRALLCLGHLDKARLFRNEALAEARQLSPFNVAYALYHFWLGDWAMYGAAGAEAMLRSADDVLAISIEQGFALWLAFGNVMRGWSLAMLGHRDEAIELLRRGLAGCGETGCGVVMPFGSLWLRRSMAAPVSRNRRYNYSHDLKIRWRRQARAGPKPKCIGCAAGSCSGCGTPRPPNRAFIVRSKWRGSKVPGSGNFALLSPLRASGAARTAGAKPMRCWRPFMVGSPRGLIYPT